MQSSFTKHFQLLVFRKLLGWKLEKSKTKKYTYHVGPDQRSLKHEWKRKLGSEHAQRAEVGQLSRSFQLNLLTLNPIREAHEWTERPVITHEVINVSNNFLTRSAHESETFNVGDEVLSERMGKTRYWSWSFEWWVNDGERGRRGLQNSRTTTFDCEAFENWLRKLRTTQIDMLFNKIYHN